MTLPNPQLIIFDKDGVLLDLAATWTPLIAAVADYLVERARGDIAIGRDALLASVGILPESGGGWRALPDGIFATGTFADMRATWQGIAPALAPIFADSETYHADTQRLRLEITRGNAVTKGAVAAELQRLKGAGYKLAVLTNDSVASTEMNFEDIKITGMFDEVICADSGHGRKPDPEGLLEICKRTGVAPDRAIMVGDTEADRGAAMNAGVAGFVAVADSAPELPKHLASADLVVRDIIGLGDVLGE